MHQHFLIVNRIAYQYLDPRKFGARSGLAGLLGGDSLCMSGLALLLAHGNGRGPDELPEHPLVGTWGFDPVVVTGDAAPFGEGLPLPWRDHATNLHACALMNFKDISFEVLSVLADVPQLIGRVQAALLGGRGAFTVPVDLAKKVGLP